MNSGPSNVFPLGDSSRIERIAVDGIRKCDYPRTQSASFVKIKRLVFVQIANACHFGAFVLFIFGLVGIGTISVAIGILNLHSCPLQKYLPIYLIAEGVLMLMALPHIVLASGRRPETLSYPNIVIILYKICLIGGEICTLVLGTFAVYAAVPPNFDPAKGPHCSKTCFLTAFFLVTATWLFIVVLIVFGTFLICCFLFCKATPRSNPTTP